MKNRRPLLVAAGIIHRQGRVLIGQRRKEDRHPYKWEFPGGKVEHRETPQAALKRELEEELHIQAHIGPELARYEHEYPRGSHVHLLFFAVPQFFGEPDPRVFEQISWVELHTLLEMDFLDGDLDFIKRLARGDFSSLLNPNDGF